VPKEGFKSITVSTESYNRIVRAYKASAPAREQAGISSLSGYVMRMMEEELLRAAVFARHKPRLKCLSIEPEAAVLRDNIAGRIVEVAIGGGALHCKACGGDACLHVGFLLSIPQVYWELEPGA